MNNQPVTQNQKSHIQFFDHVRIIAMLCVVLYHSVTAYSTTTPQFPVHDSEPLVFANYVRWIFDVFMMPVFFFVAGFFAVPSVKSKGPGLFILSKIKRLGIPWLALMISLAGFMNFGYIFMSAFKRQEIVSFGDSLIHMLKGLVTFEIADHGDQMHLWFLSLLLFFFVLFAIVYMISKKYFNIFFTGNRSITSSGRSVFNVMLFSGIVLTAGYFIVVILFPGINDWIHLSFLSFEPTKTVSYVVCFCMGIYGYSRNWFAERIGIKYINIWAVTGILSLAIFLISGNEILVERAVPEGFSLLQLGVFSIARSFLCISVLFLLVSIAHRYLNFASRFTKKLSENSYHIYIIHLFLVLALQAGLRGWAQGPAWLKLVIVFLSAVIFSYLISEYITNRFPKATLVFLVLISISLIFIINPYSYERKFDNSQSEIFEKQADKNIAYSALKEKAISSFRKALKAPDKQSLKEAFENLTIAYFTKKNDYEIMSYLGRITVLMVPYDMTENHLDYLVYYTKGFNWMDKAVEMEPDNINIRLNRAIESMKYPDILNREDCAKTDFEYLAGLIGNYPDMQKPVKKEVYSNLAELYEKEGDSVKSRIYKKRLNELE